MLILFTRQWFYLGNQRLWPSLFLTSRSVSLPIILLLSTSIHEKPTNSYFNLLHQMLYVLYNLYIHFLRRKDFKNAGRQMPYILNKTTITSQNCTWHTQLMIHVIWKTLFHKALLNGNAINILLWLLHIYIFIASVQ